MHDGKKQRTVPHGLSRSTRELACSCIVFLLLCLWMHCQCQQVSPADRNGFPCNLFNADADGTALAIVPVDPMPTAASSTATTWCGGQSCPNLQIPPSMGVSLFFLSVFAFAI
ncbi:Uncharacterized protein PBTT_03016 [Plasmodiophora brassicae]|uniref:Uncharacterized protein n=1 Tax=Plasmodiophora brassicae TaxID=37360 RepID=A0A3P3Y5R8_PLABS|nr:unnamed protein product [Plasmodiophora brassicae]